MQLDNTWFFLDRDGVINIERGDYVHNLDEFAFIPGAREALAKLYQKGAKFIIITNQGGISRGVLTPQIVNEIHNYMQQELEKFGIKIEAIYFCPHLEADNCSCRKPNPGMILEAAKRFNIKLNQSFLIGDSLRDIEAGNKASCKTILLRTGKGKLEEDLIKKKETEIIPNYIYNDLWDMIKNLFPKIL